MLTCKNEHVKRLYESKTARVLVLLPHSDDEVLGCGGLLYTLRMKHARIRAVYLTDGSVCENNVPNIVCMRQEEAVSGMKYMGIDDLTFADFEDGTLNDTTDVLSTYIENEINLFGPSLLVAPQPYDHHSDHSAIGQVVCKLNRDKYPCARIFYEVWGGIEDPNVWLILNNEVYLTLYQWCSFYQSQKKIKQYLYGSRRYRGRMKGCRFAEAYSLLE